MKRKFSILAVAAALLMGGTSCNKDNGVTESSGDGTLKISFNFETKTPPQSRAAESDAKPTTAWVNITDLQLVLVQGGVAKVVRPVTIPGDGTAPSQIFDRIPVGPYDIYLVGNNNKVGNLFGSTTARIGTSAPIQAGTNFNAALFSMIAAGSGMYLGNAPTKAAYDEASELFIGYATGTITADVITPTINVDLKRAVSLLRVRIDQTDAVSEANKIVFTDGSANTSIRLRRHAEALKLSATPTVAPYFAPQFNADKNNCAFVSTKGFKKVEPVSGYTGTMGISTDFTLWNDYVILPGGDDSIGANKFNFLLSGHAPDGYVGVNGAISTGTGEAARVWWQADVDGLIAANGILSLNVKVATKGFVGPNPPEVDTYGKLDITATLFDWSPVTNVSVPL